MTQRAVPSSSREAAIRSWYAEQIANNEHRGGICTNPACPVGMVGDLLARMDQQAETEKHRQQWLHVDARPDGDYALRILRAYREQCNTRWSSTILGVAVAGGESNPLLAELNRYQDERGAELDAAIAKLQQVADLSARVETLQSERDAFRDEANAIRRNYLAETKDLATRADAAEAEVARLRALSETQAAALLNSQLRVSWLEGIGMPHARRQENANGFQKGWHAALSRAGERAESIEDLRALVPEPAANPDDTLPLPPVPASSQE